MFAFASMKMMPSADIAKWWEENYVHNNTEFILCLTRDDGLQRIAKQIKVTYEKIVLRLQTNFFVCFCIRQILLILLISYFISHNNMSDKNKTEPYVKYILKLIVMLIYLEQN